MSCSGSYETTIWKLRLLIIYCLEVIVIYKYMVQHFKKYSPCIYDEFARAILSIQ
jgi:hypothetical protein